MNKIHTSKKSFFTLLFLSIFVLSLAGCSSTVDLQKMAENESVESIQEEQETTTNNSEKEMISLYIEGGRIFPNQITVPLGKETTLEIHNRAENTMRFEIPLYQSEVLVDIPEGGYEYVTINPVAPGRVLMNLNGASLGTVIIEN